MSWIAVAGDARAVAPQCLCGCHRSSVLQTRPALKFTQFTLLLSVVIKLFCASRLLCCTLCTCYDYHARGVHWHSEAVCAAFEMLSSRVQGQVAFLLWPITTGFAEKRWKQADSLRILSPCTLSTPSSGTLSRHIRTLTTKHTPLPSTPKP